MTISRQFYAIATQLPNKVAVIEGTRQVTYAGLLALVQQQALVLRANDVERGNHVMCQLAGIDFIVLLLACADAGVCLVPMSKDATRATVAKAYAVCDCKALITEPCAENAGRGNIMKLKFTGRPNDNFLIITTSGSTGDPKPILLKQGTKLARARMMQELYHCTEDDVTLISTPLYHSMGQRLVLMSVLNGGTLVLMGGWSAEKWVELVNEHEVTFAVPVASQVKQIMDWDEYTPSMRCMVSSSALLTANDVGSARRGYPLFNCYGTTEVSIVTSTDDTTPEGSVGRPIAGVGVSIAPDGEILADTPLLFDGYYNQPELTESAAWRGIFATGDLGRIDADGNLYYLGRIKDLINVGGAKVYPQDIEVVFAGYPAIVECAAFPQVDEALGEIVALAIVLKETELATAFDWTREIQTMCLPHLTDAQLPRAVYVMTEPLPRTETGKLQRGKLAAMVGADK